MMQSLARSPSQLVLDLGLPPPATFDNFVIGPNSEAVERLRALASGDRAQRFLYLWGPVGSGRSHLLAALASAVRGQARLLGPSAPLSAFVSDSDVLVTLIDDVHALDALRQEAAFHLYVAAQQDPTLAFVATGNDAPLGLTVREDLRTRLGGALVLRLEAPSDEDKRAALLAAARERGVTIAPEVIDYMLSHLPRDLPALMGTLDALDRFALERKRAITLALYRDFSQKCLPQAATD